MPAFTSTSSSASNIDLIPHGTLAWAWVSGAEIKNSRSSSGEYGAIELTLRHELQDGTEGPLNGRKIFTNVMNPDDERNSEGARKMGMAALSRMIEAAQLVNPANEASYQDFNSRFPYFNLVLAELVDKLVAIRIKLVPEKDGYSAKNEVADWLSPNPASSGNKDWVRLCNGDTEPKKAGAPTPPPAFTQPQAAGVAIPGAPPSPAATPARPAAPPVAAPHRGASMRPAAGQPAAWLTQANPQGAAVPPGATIKAPF